jgi:hypothetical protein
VRVLQARRQEGQVVVEGGLRQQAGAVAAAAEAGPVASFKIGGGLKGAPALALAGVERRIDVDQLEALVGEALQHREVVPEDHLVAGGAAALHRCGRS